MSKRRDKGDGSIYQRASDGLWVGSVRLEKGKRKYVYGATKQEAMKKLKEVHRNIESGTLITAKHQTVEAYLRYWLDIHKAEIAESTYRNYCHILKRVYPHIGPIRLDKLTPDQIQRMYNAVGKDHAISYIRQLHRVLVAAFNAAIKWRKIARNPCLETITPKRVYGDDIQHALTAEQCQTLLDASQGSLMETFIVVALGTGMRRGEILALRWSDINIDGRTVSVVKSVSYLEDDQGRSRHVEGSPKSRKKRSIALADFVVDALKSHKKHQLEQRLAATQWQDNGLVFTNKTGGFFSVPMVEYRFKKLLEQTDLPAIHIHDLRHSCATLLLKKGVPIKVIQEILGHSSIQVTMNVYGHVSHDMQEDAMSKMDGMFKNKEKEG